MLCHNSEEFCSATLNYSGISTSFNSQSDEAKSEKEETLYLAHCLKKISQISTVQGRMRAIKLFS